MEPYLYDDLYALEETHWWHRNKRRLITSLLARFAPKKKIRIIDIGCGTGKNVETFARFGQSWGLDASKRAITFCRKRELTRIKQGTAENSGLPSGSFDVVTLLDVLEHTDDRKTIREMHRILAPCGLIVITVPAYRWMWSTWDVVLHHRRRYEKNDLERLMRESGFQIKKCSFVYSFLLLPVLIVRFVKTQVLRAPYGSDFRLSNPFLNWLMYGICGIESWCVVHGYVPFGTSIVCVGQKR